MWANIFIPTSADMTFGFRPMLQPVFFLSQILKRDNLIEPMDRTDGSISPGPGSCAGFSDVLGLGSGKT